MASALNLDSITVDKTGRVSFSGLGTGIDLRATVDSIIEAKRIPIDTIDKRVTERETKIAALQDFKALSLALRDAAEKLKGAVTFDGSGDIFESKQAFASTSRDDAITPSKPAELVGIAVTNAAQATSHTLEIEQTASAHKVAGDTLAVTTTDPLGFAGTIEINGQAITIDAADDILEVRDRINGANKGDNATGVTASVVSLSSGEQVLILTADQTGTDGTMTLSDAGGNVLKSLGVIKGNGTIKNELQQAQNARFTVDGLGTTIERQSNTIDDVFTGMTLTLFKGEVGTTVEIAVERDLGQVKQGIVDLVEAYNEVRAFINQQAMTDVPEDDETGAGILAGTSVLSDVRARLSGAVGAAVDGTDPVLAVLGQIGITIQGPGRVADPLLANTLAIDETKLDEALLNQPDAVRDLFAFEMSSSSSDVVLVGFDGHTSFSSTGYQLNVAYSGGAVTSANLGGAADGSDDGTVQVQGNVLTVLDGPAKGLKMLFTGNAPASGVQLDVSVGVGAKMFHTVDGLVDEIDGLFQNEIEVLTEQNTRASERMLKMEERLERERERLLERFALMEAALTSMNQLIDSLKSQIDSAFGKRT